MLRIILIISIIVISSQREWIKYNKCDEEWKNITVYDSDLKMCDHPENAGKEVDGALITVLATAYASYNLKCGGETCTPKTLNDLIGKYEDIDEFYKSIGVKDSHLIEEDSLEVEDYLEQGCIIVGITGPGKDNLHDSFVLDFIDSKGMIHGIISDGRNLVFPKSQALEYRYFELAKKKRNSKKDL